VLIYIYIYIYIYIIYLCVGRIWGDGPERERLEALSLSLGLRGRLHFMGATDTPEKALAEVV